MTKPHNNNEKQKITIEIEIDLLDYICWERFKKLYSDRKTQVIEEKRDIVQNC